MPTSPRPRSGDPSLGAKRKRIVRRLAVPGLLAISGSAAVPSLAAAASTTAVTVANVPGVGKVLVSGHRVLYVHTGDTKRHSTCTGVCATAWPPLLVSAKAAHHLGRLHGLGTFRRSHGHLQVAIDGHPLYFFAGDSTLTSAKGQGFANVFFTVRPNGSAVHVATAASPGAPAPTSATSTPSTSPSTSTTTARTSTPTTQGSHGAQPPAPPVPTSTPPTSPPATTTTSPPATTTTRPPTTTTTAPSGGGVSF